jgi:histidinol-phosphate aminotransferase
MKDVRVMPREHGGPGAAGPVRWDFSTNAHPAGPCPVAWLAVQQADPSRYPDPGYHGLRERLGAWHGVAPQRILLAASASEFIQRITAVTARLWPGAVAVPAYAYGDYAAAALACGLTPVRGTAGTGQHMPIALRWYADPGSPQGQSTMPPMEPAAVPTVVDRVYAPLRLQGADPWPAHSLDAVFQLHSPNKALGLTGVRGAYAVAPVGDDARTAVLCAGLRAAEPSWPLGTHGVALLAAWIEPATQAWLRESLPLLRGWTATLRSGLQALGLQPQASDAPFLCARRPLQADATWLRARGLAVRDTTSFGMPGQMRVSAQPLQAIQGLLRALHDALQVTPDETPPYEAPMDPHPVKAST